jgi:uncharacterized protein YuzE
MISQSFDIDADALYIELHSRAVARTVQIDSGTLVDLDDAGQLLGIEVIHPQRSWPLHAIIERFGVTADAALELNTYFPMIAQTSPPSDALQLGLRVAIHS